MIIKLMMMSISKIVIKSRIIKDQKVVIDTNQIVIKVKRILVVVDFNQERIIIITII
jgi:hypothetical protein